MTIIAMLWLPILLSAVFVFVISAITHMAVPYRHTEWTAAPDQAAIQKSLAGQKPGLYVFPSPLDNKDRSKPEEMKRWAEGPSGFVTLVPQGPISFGRNLGLSFLINVLVSLCVAFAAMTALGPKAPYMAVFHLVGVIGFLTYSVGTLYEGVWYWKPWKSLAMNVLDAVLYGLAMAGTFGWLWPR